MKKALVMLLSLALILALAVPAFAANADEVKIALSDAEVTVDGKAASSDSSEAVFVSHDIIYYEDRDTWDNGNPYGEGTASERHSAEEAAAHTVVNITQPGTYRLSGKLSQGQVFVNINKGKSNAEAVVTLILDNVDITCTVAPAVFFYNVYECDRDWIAYDDDELEEYPGSGEKDTTAAGANVIIADGSVNNVTGSHVARIYKEDGSLKDDGSHKKLHKYDGAFYSTRSMNITGGTVGDGVLNIIGDNEGLDSDVHLTINGGRINVQGQDDGVNTSEDNVSVFTMNGGEIHVLGGLGAEGDGIDSNGYITINGGVVIAIAKPQSDSGLDSDRGTTINGGYVVATGSTMDYAESTSKQATMNLQFASAQGADESVIITDTDGKVVFAYDPDKDEATGTQNRGYQGAVISCPELKQGGNYHVYVGGDVQGTEVNGVYDASTVTGFTGAFRQVYTGTSVGRPGPGGFPGGPDGENPGGFPGGPDGMNPPDGMGPPPDGAGGPPPEGGGQPPEGGPGGPPPEGMGPPPGEGENPGGFPGGPGGMGPGQSEEEGEPSNLFFMAETVSAFSGVKDESETPVDVGGTPSDSRFTDVAKDAYYYDPVMWAVEKEITVGTSDTEFSPDRICSRAEIITFLWRAAGSPEPASSENPYGDVNGDAYYYKAALWAHEKGMVTGTTFDGGVDCTRASTVQYIWQAAGSPEPTAKAEFSDVASDAEYAQAVAWAVEQKITVGTGSAKFSPDVICSRAQIVTLLYRAFAK